MYPLWSIFFLLIVSRYNFHYSTHCIKYLICSMLDVVDLKNKLPVIFNYDFYDGKLMLLRFLLYLPILLAFYLLTITCTKVRFMAWNITIILPLYKISLSNPTLRQITTQLIYSFVELKPFQSTIWLANGINWFHFYNHRRKQYASIQYNMKICMTIAIYRNSQVNKIDCSQIGKYDVMLFYMMSYESIGTELMMNQNAKLNLTVF